MRIDSPRLCKKCFRHIEALNKLSKVIEDSKREIVKHYEKTKESNKAWFWAEIAITLSGLPNKAPARASKEERGAPVNM